MPPSPFTAAGYVAGAEKPLLYDPAKSPFLDLGSHFTLWEAIKMLILLPTVPIRLAFIAFCAVVVSIINSLIIAGCNMEKPLPPWRRRLVEMSSSFFSGVILSAAGIWGRRIKGYENLKKGNELGAIAVFNHVSYMDAFTIVWFMVPAGITVNYSKHLPLLGPGIRALQNIYLPKESHEPPAPNQPSTAQRIKARAMDRSMPMLGIAPEGTLGNGHCLLEFKTGAFVPGVPVVPILMRYQLSPFNPAWTIIRIPWHPLRLMCQFRVGLEVEALPPYVPSAAERADPVLYAANMRKLMADRLGVPMVDEDRTTFLALNESGLGVSYDGRRVTAPPGVLRPDGLMDLAPWMEKVLKRKQANNANKKRQ